MKFVSFAALLASVALVSVNADGATTGKDGKSWGYKENNPSMYGPSEWGAQYPTCAGKRQSPIDVKFDASCKRSAVSAPLKYAGSCSSFKLTQTDDSYKGEVQNGTCSVSTNGKAFSMLQFHMHAPAEHTLNGKLYDGEAHFVHTNADSSALLVVGVFLEKKKDAKTDPWLKSVWNTLGAVNSTAAPTPIKLGSYASLLTAASSKGRVFNYPGSLTTPTCTEIVDWWVLEKPMQVSSADFDKFQAHLAKLPATDRGRGARPVQPLNGRAIKVY